jgi:endonuclease VIII
MPEGPSIVILKEELMPFRGKKVLEVSGNAGIDIDRLLNKKVEDFKSWGKHFILCFRNFFLRVHMLMWGTYRVNERKDAPPRLRLRFKNGEVNFYTCSIKMHEGHPDEMYDWETDVMSEAWNEKKALKTVKSHGHELATDILLNQGIFAGVGNIIKNEVLFRIKVHPESVIEYLPPRKLKELVAEARNYSFDFYRWKKVYELKKNWLIYKKKTCPRCKIPVTRTWLGQTDRLTCYCSNCQVLYTAVKKKAVKKKLAKATNQRTKTTRT